MIRPRLKKKIIKFCWVFPLICVAVAALFFSIIGFMIMAAWASTKFLGSADYIIAILPIGLGALLTWHFMEE